MNVPSEALGGLGLGQAGRRLNKYCQAEKWERRKIRVRRWLETAAHPAIVKETENRLAWWHVSKEGSRRARDPRSPSAVE